MIVLDANNIVPLALAAQRLGISRERALRRVISGSLQGVQFSGRWFVAEDSLQRCESATPARGEAAPEAA